ncbi:hypothetical protein T4B_8274 [Trichinella pseudospiralis]|uniref:Uncharacterized protein n=1 Tax=Trichinella pseudospiralis TaxID=6337 RepID=A0A0V1JIP2_TRIPS|nr:hypothetical protein T4B_8274 [Trichinella pseudospiralis]
MHHHTNVMCNCSFCFGTKGVYSDKDYLWSELLFPYFHFIKTDIIIDITSRKNLLTAIAFPSIQTTHTKNFENLPYLRVNFIQSLFCLFFGLYLCFLDSLRFM